MFETSDAAQTAQIIRRAAAQGYAALYITEQAAVDVMDVIDEYKDSELPAIILIPGIAGSLGIGMAGVKRVWSAPSVRTFCLMTNNAAR